MDQQLSERVIDALLTQIDELKVEARSAPVVESGNPKLVYFPIAGRGELIRLICAAGELKLEEATDVPEGESRQLYGSPGSLPVLQHGNLKMSQSTAIENYLASIVFSSLTPAQHAIDSQFMSIKEDILGGAAGILFAAAGSEPSVTSEKLVAHFDKWFPLVESMVPASGFVNKQSFPTAADLCIVNMMEAYMPMGAGMKIASYDTSKYTKLVALNSRVKAVPSVAAYLSKSTSIKAAAFGL